MEWTNKCTICLQAAPPVLARAVRGTGNNSACAESAAVKAIESCGVKSTRVAAHARAHSIHHEGTCTQKRTRKKTTRLEQLAIFTCVLGRHYSTLTLVLHTDATPPPLTHRSVGGRLCLRGSSVSRPLRTNWIERGRVVLLRGEREDSGKLYNVS